MIKLVGAARAMSWLDLVLAVPAVGLRLKPSLSAAVDYPRLMAPLVDELVEELGDANLSLNNPPNFGLKTSDGLSHSVTPDNVVVEYAYPVAGKRESGCLPNTPAPKQVPYSDLLELTIRRFIRIIKALGKQHAFKVNRVGFIAATRMSRKKLPPGVDSLIKHLEKPWKSPLLLINSNLVASISEAGGTRDQCHHILVQDSASRDNPDEIEFKMDWQRQYLPEKDHRTDELERQVIDCKKAALGYFERVGEGGLNIE
jgi:hypothetical protein